MAQNCKAEKSKILTLTLTHMGTHILTHMYIHTCICMHAYIYMCTTNNEWIYMQVFMWINLCITSAWVVSKGLLNFATEQ